MILETVPATSGFPVPASGDLPEVQRLCRSSGTLYIADEVQTGLGRTGSLWAVAGFGVVPDILVTAKGLSGGLYPIAATLLSPAAGEWLESSMAGATSPPSAGPRSAAGSQRPCWPAPRSCSSAAASRR